MKTISKGQKSNTDGVILTKKEYKEYKKLLQIVNEFKSYKKDYDLTYKSYLM